MFQELETTPFNFLGITSPSYEKAKCVVVPVPLEISTSYKKGTSEGPEAILSASRQIELYDCECRFSPYEQGIYTASEMVFSFETNESFQIVIRKWVKQLIKDDKFFLLLGGEHTLTVPAVEATLSAYPKLNVVQIDAHADFRDRYQGNSLSHACVGRRIAEFCPLLQIGVRSMSQEEAEALAAEKKVKTIQACDLESEIDYLAFLDEDVYLTLDVDAFDPSIIPSTGTPEPGGLTWKQINAILSDLFARKNVVGMDITEFSPIGRLAFPAFTIAKLAYRCIGWKTIQKIGGAYAKSFRIA